MSLSLEPNKGLRLKLGRLSPIRTWQGGASFWSHEFQLTVRSGALAGFLPRAIEDEDSVLFEYRSGGAEQAGTSTAISDMSEIPAKELHALRAAVDELKKKAEDPHCDRTKRQMIEGFRLPDPQKDRDLYRLIGKGSSAKLIVLWGIEREEGSALSPGAAVDLMHTPAGEEAAQAAAPAPKKSKLAPILLLLAVLGAGGWYYYQQEQEKKRLAAEQAAALAAKQAQDARLKAEQERIAAFNAAAAAKSAATAIPSSPPKPVTGTSTTPMTPTVADSPKSTPPSPASAPTTSDPKKSADSKSTTSTDSTKKSTETPKAATSSSMNSTTSSTSKSSDAGKSKSATSSTPATSKSTTTSNTTTVKPIAAAPGTIIRNSSGVVTGVVGKDGKFAHAQPGTTVNKDGKVTSHAPGTVIRGSSGAVTGIAGKDGQVVPTKLGRIVEDAKGTLKNGPPGTLVRDSKGTITGVADADGKIIPATPGTVLDKEGKVISSAPGTVLRDSFGTVTGVADADGKIINAAPGAVLEDDSVKNMTADTAATPPGSVSTPMTSQGPPPAGISSLSVVSTSLSGVLGNGNVEVLLNVVARNTAGAVVNAPQINGWKVNGQLQTKPDGTPADGPVIPVSLPPGTHRISTVGRGSDGQPYQTDADVLVTPK